MDSIPGEGGSRGGTGSIPGEGGSRGGTGSIPGGGRCRFMLGYKIDIAVSTQ